MLPEIWSCYYPMSLSFFFLVKANITVCDILFKDMESDITMTPSSIICCIIQDSTTGEDKEQWQWVSFVSDTTSTLWGKLNDLLK